MKSVLGSSILMKRTSITATAAALFFTIAAAALLHTNQYEFIYLRFEGMTRFKLSLFDTVLYAGYLLVGMIVAFLSGKTGRRKVIILAGSAGSILFYLLMTVSREYWILLMMRFLQGACTVSAWQLLFTVGLEIAPPEKRGRYMGILGIGLGAASGAGTFIGGAVSELYPAAPYHTAMAFAAAALLFVAAFLKDPEEAIPKASVVESIRILKKRTLLFVPSMFNFIDRLHMGFILFLLPLFLNDVLGSSPGGRGVVFGIYSLFFLLTYYPVGRLSDRWGRFQFIIPGSILFGIVLIVVGIAGGTHFAVTAVLFGILGIAAGLAGPPNNALVGDYTKRHERAEAMGLFTFAGNIGVAAGPVLAGWLISLADYRTVFIIGGAIELIFLAAGLISLRLSGRRIFTANSPSGS